MRTSVVIANYNYGRFLPAALESLFRQTVAPDEIIVVDDGSTDNSREILAGYAGRIVTVLQENAGQAAAISNGFARATGDLVFLFDSDDIFLPRKIEVVGRLYEENPDLGWIFHELRYFSPGETPADEVSDIVSKPIDEREAITRGLLTYNVPPTSGLTFRRAFIAPLFPLPVAESIYISDHYIKFYALATGKGLHVQTPLGAQLLHGENLYTGRNNLATRARIFANTAWFLALAAPQTKPLCDRLSSTAISCALQTGGLKHISAMTRRYLRTRPMDTRIIIAARALVSFVRRRPF